MTCQIMQLQTFAPAKVIYQPKDVRMYTMDDLVLAAMKAVKLIIYPEMTEANKKLYDAPRSIFSLNRNRSIVAARYFIMYFLYVDFKWHDRKCAQVFGMDRTASLWARKMVHEQLSSKIDNQYKEIYRIIESNLK